MSVIWAAEESTKESRNIITLPKRDISYRLFFVAYNNGSVQSNSYCISLIMVQKKKLSWVDSIFLYTF